MYMYTSLSIHVYIYIYVYTYMYTVCVYIHIYIYKGTPEYCQDGTVTHLNFNRLLYNMIGYYRL